MKERKTLLNRENVEKVKGAAEQAMEAIPDDLLDQASGAGNPFDNVPRVPTQPIDDDLRQDG